MASSSFVPPPTGPVGAAVRAGGDIMDMAQLLTIRVELSPETLHVLINDASSHHAVLCRSRIDAALVGISNMCDLDPSDPPVPCLFQPPDVNNFPRFAHLKQGMAGGCCQDAQSTTPGICWTSNSPKRS